MNLLAFDTSTDQLSIAVRHGDTVWHFQGEGGAQASSQLIPQIHNLLQQAQLRVSDLEGIAFGAGPGAFTGLRAACSVAQGLAFAHDCPVLPINTLYAMAYQLHVAEGAQSVLALLDARMDEVYWQAFDFALDTKSHLTAPALCAPEQLGEHTRGTTWVVGNAWAVYGERLGRSLGQDLDQHSPMHNRHALPDARVMLAIAEQMRAKGEGVSAEQALPLYVRNKVAQTTAERMDAQSRQHLQDKVSAAQRGVNRVLVRWSPAQSAAQSPASDEVTAYSNAYCEWMVGVDEAEIIHIEVLPQTRRQGLARGLLQEVIAQAKSLGREALCLEVRQSNHAAIGLYEQMGFVRVGLRKDYYPALNAKGESQVVNHGSGREHAIVMKYKL